MRRHHRRNAAMEAARGWSVTATEKPLTKIPQGRPFFLIDEFDTSTISDTMTRLTYRRIDIGKLSSEEDHQVRIWATPLLGLPECCDHMEFYCS
jgi:hypothetical protein